MSDFLRLLLVFAAAVSPAATLGALGTAGAARRTELLLTGAIVAAALALLAVLLSNQIMSALDLEPATFRVSAGAVMAAVGGLAVLRGAPAYTVEEGWRGGLFPLAIPLLAGPAVLVAAVAYPPLHGRGETAAAAVIIIVVTAAGAWLAGSRTLAAYGAIARVTGALLVALAAGLIVDGVHDI